jgi:hypothetical protein
MTLLNQIGSRMVEFHRFGGQRAKQLDPSNEYIRTAGFDETVSVVRPSVDQEGSLDLLYLLRYQTGVPPQQVKDAQAKLGGYATAFLPSIPLGGKGLVQIDLVSNAAELWAFPFEACYEANSSWLDKVDSGVVITRRIRGGFSDEALPWPDRPRVLFAHAPADSDLQQSLIDNHANALREALQPWSRGAAVDDSLLRVAEVVGLKALAKAREEFNPATSTCSHMAPSLRRRDRGGRIRIGDFALVSAARTEGPPRRSPKCWLPMRASRSWSRSRLATARTRPSSPTRTTALRRSCTDSAFPLSSRPSFR